MISLFLLFNLVTNQIPVDKSLPRNLAPPSGEVTRAKVKALTDKMAEIKDKTDKLNSITVKLEVQGDRDVDSFVNDSIFILKLRADILISLVDIFEEALTARYNLEATLDEYSSWIKHAMGDSGSRNKQFQGKIVAFEAENKVILDDAIILTDFLQRKITSHLKSVQDKINELQSSIEIETDMKKKSELFIQLNILKDKKNEYDRSLKEKTIALLDKNDKPVSLLTIENRNDIEKKYETIAGTDPDDIIKQLELKLEDLKTKYNLNSYEIYAIKTDVLKPDDVYIKKLRLDQQKLIETSKILLRDTKDYSFRAQKIYIASKYVKIMIDDSIKAGGDISNIAIALENTITNDPIISKALDAASGTAPVAASLRELLNKRFDTDKETTDKQPKIEKGSDKE